MVPYDVQLMGGIQLHLGKIAEMATGEGKTLVATLPLYLNALPGKGAHLVTVNSYLARRDSQWMGHLYRYLGLTVGCIDDTEPGTPERRAAYVADITYGTNNEFGFDYLRDNMVVVARSARAARARVTRSSTKWTRCSSTRRERRSSSRVRSATRTTRCTSSTTPRVARLVRRQTELVNVLVGEAERDARSGRHATTAALKLYKAQLGSPKNKRLMKVLQEPGDKQLVQKMELEHIADRKLPASKQQYRDIEEDLLFVLDEKGHSVHLTDRGVDFMSPNDHDAFVLPDISQRGASDRSRSGHDGRGEARGAARRSRSSTRRRASGCNIVHQLLRAHALYEKDVNYVVQDGEVLIVDEFTGRTMPGRRWSEGLHQAVEAKEGVQREGRDADARDDHDPELLPHVREAGRHDRHGRDGRDGVLPDLQARSRGHPDEPADRSATTGTISSTRRGARSTTRSSRRRERLHELGYPVLVGTTSVDASETLSTHVQARGHPAQRAERQVPPARGRDRRRARASRARSRSRRTWPAAEPTSNSARASRSRSRRR